MNSVKVQFVCFCDSKTFSGGIRTVKKSFSGITNLTAFHCQVGRVVHSLLLQEGLLRSTKKRVNPMNFHFGRDAPCEYHNHNLV